MKIDVPTSLDEWNARGADFLPGHMSMNCLAVSGEEVRIELAVKPGHLSWNGFLHGGTVVALADTCCGYGTVASLPQGANGFTTVDLTTNFIGSVQEGKVLCTAKPVHQGRSTQVWDALVSSEAGKDMAHFRCTQLILWPR